MRPKPYISVSGVMDADPLLDRVFSSVSRRTESIARAHGLTFGVLVSEKTLYGAGNKYPNRYPAPANDRAWRAAARHGALNFVHYNADTDEKLGAALVDAVLAVEQSGRTVHGVQVNVHWPDPGQLRFFAANFPQKRVVLQVRSDLAGGWSNPEALRADLAKHYAWVVTDVLLDSSGGAGVRFDHEKMAPVVNHLTKEMPHLGIGIAGGLCASALADMQAMLRTFPHISIDAEGALRDNVADGGGHLNLDKVVGYLSAARIVFGV